MAADRSTLCLAAALTAIAGLGIAPSVKPLLRPPQDPTHRSVVPDFSLLDADERIVARRDLSGHVWVADFIYLQCTDTCPLLSKRIVELLRKTAAAPLADQVRFVSFSVAPDDGPKALRRFLRSFKGEDLRRWHVLAAQTESVARVAKAFGVMGDEAATRRGDVPISSNLFLVDRDGVVRGAYDGTTHHATARLSADLIALATARP